MTNERTSCPHWSEIGERKEKTQTSQHVKMIAWNSLLGTDSQKRIEQATNFARMRRDADNENMWILLHHVTIFTIKSDSK